MAKDGVSMRKQSSRSGTLSSLRRANTEEVISALQRTGGMTQVEIAETTNLSAATVSSIVRELTQKGTLDTSAVSRNNRHALYVTLASSDKIAVGISIERIELRVVLGDASHRVLSEKHLPLAENHQPDTTIIQSIVLIRDMLSSLSVDLKNIASITLALPAPVDSQGNVAVPEVFPGWYSDDIRERFRRAFGVVPHIANDANMACMAEVNSGIPGSPANLIYLHADYLLGGAYVVNSHLFIGSKGVAGEFGHIQADPMGPICECGRRGCLNTVASAGHLVSLLRLTRGNISIRDIFDLAEQGDVGCLRLVQDTAEVVARVIEPEISSFDPDVVVVGGRFSSIDLFVEVFVQTMKKIMFPNWSDRKVIRGTLGSRAVAIGSMIQAADRINL